MDPDFSATVFNGRNSTADMDYPGSKAATAYRVWLSEIMLQQTQVTRSFRITRTLSTAFSGPFSLAAAPPRT
jgi:A/G-specific adenine glycosylase